MKIIGLTGGIGSGKTTVAKAFQKLNVPVYIADDRSKYLLSNDAKIISSVKDLLGNDAYIIENGNKVANRSFISSKVFKDKKLLAQLNAILHPAVHVDFNSFCKKHLSEPYVVYEAAILFETGGDKKCDYTILVTVSEESRMERVMKRDGVSMEAVKARIKNQWSQERKINLADIVVINENIDNIPLYIGYIHYFILNTK